MTAFTKNNKIDKRMIFRSKNIKKWYNSSSYVYFKVTTLNVHILIVLALCAYYFFFDIIYYEEKY